jgi:hypothetical protein
LQFIDHRALIGQDPETSRGENQQFCIARITPQKRRFLRGIGKAEKYRAKAA